jgi:adenylate cyclase
VSLLAELRRRKILRVAALYAAVAWLLIQVATTIAPLMSLPESVPRFVLFLLILLFPVALLLAWAYQVTHDGIRLDTGPEAMERKSGTRRGSLCAIC